MLARSVSAGDIHQDAFATRLRHAVNLFGGPSPLARAIGRSEGAVRKWLRGDSEPNVTDLRAICAVCGANAEWLVNGVGDSGLIPHQVAEPVLAYGASAAMDYDLLERIITAVDEESAACGSKIATNTKSSMVSTLYGLCRSGGVLDRSAVSRLVKLAV